MPPAARRGPRAQSHSTMTPPATKQEEVAKEATEVAKPVSYEEDFRALVDCIKAERLAEPVVEYEVEEEKADDQAVKTLDLIDCFKY